MSSEQRRLGPFLLEERLGAGGMGVVYRAVHVEKQRPVAIKILSERAASSKRIVARFNRESEILKALKHPNIVRYYGNGREGKEIYLVMELITGGSISSLLRRRGKLSWEATVELGIQICDGLFYAHEWGVVHRDLTPSNLLLTEQGQVKIADFGIARAQLGKRLTAAKHTLGTLAYMAPEQIRGEPAISPRTDLYTLGCVFFEMLTGQLPFQADNSAKMLYAHLEEQPPRVSSLVLDCPIWLDHLVAQMLEKNPLNRPYDAGSVGQALREVQKKVAEGAAVSKQAVSGSPTALKVPQAQRDKEEVRKLVRKKKKKKRGEKVPFYERAWFLAACLLLVVGAGVWLVWPAGEAELFAKAEKLMNSGDRTQWERARTDYLRPLLARFPAGDHAAKAQEYLDEIEMEQTMAQLKLRAEKNRKPTSEGERLFRDAWEYEQFGDRISALDKYQAMVDLMSATEKGSDKDRAYVNLARRQIARLKSQDQGLDDRRAFIESRLAHADELLAKGEKFEARKIWDSIVTLYRTNSELAPLVERAQQRLAGDADKKGDKQPSESPPEPASVASGDVAPPDVKPRAARRPRRGARAEELPVESPADENEPQGATEPRIDDGETIDAGTDPSDAEETQVGEEDESNL